MWRVRVTVARETQQCVLYIVELHVTVNNKNTECHTTMLLWRIYVAGNNTTYLGLHVTCQILTEFGVSGQIFFF